MAPLGGDNASIDTQAEVAAALSGNEANRPRLRAAVTDQEEGQEDKPQATLSSTPSSLNVMTFNLRFAGTGDGRNSWRFRKDHVADIIDRYHPAIMGTQEGLKAQLAELQELLKHPYERFGVEREENGEFEQIFYDAGLLERLDGGDFWLSEQPNTRGTQGWDAACVRMVTWCKFRLRATQQELFVFNTQLDHVGPTSRTEGSKLLWDRIQQITGSPDTPLFLMGDFNTYRHTSTYSYFTSQEDGPKLLEAWPEAEKQIGDVSYTYHGWAGVKNDGEVNAVRAANHIDWIFYRPQMKVLSTEVITEDRNGRYPSDHYPIQAEVLFPGPALLPPPRAN
ncbi:hypothetical protein BBJ29_005929 [Phytophthora kernoviae]|uniref:Endonuclease/exonuclease/phosphatase domain-containing protein n=1 Tax=Phytophthora kernoviae TaxID=325452 RepID=A0A3F2RTK8_9STRA|nr:hypothetical protein BBJ29_005929 [Phytophthora kernoviae]RLN63986.1 hypothetical protein BBP00_00003762 [Phytophthora kernoviae]